MTQSNSPVARALRTLNQSAETHTTTGSTEQVDTDRIKAAVREGVAEALADAEVSRGATEVEAEAEDDEESSDPDARGRPSGGKLLLGVVLLAVAAFLARSRDQSDPDEAVSADFDTDGGIDTDEN